MARPKAVGDCTPVNPALRRLRQEELKFKASLGYIIGSKPTWATKCPGEDVCRAEDHRPDFPE